MITPITEVVGLEVRQVLPLYDWKLIQAVLEEALTSKRITNAGNIERFVADLRAATMAHE